MRRPGSAEALEEKEKTRAPTAEDFTNDAVQKAVFKDTIQHPVTLGFGGLASVVVLWMLLIGISPKSLLLLIAFAFFSVGFWVFNFFVRGETLARAHVAKLRRRREQHMHAEVHNIGRDCLEAHFAEGAKAAHELHEAYVQMGDFLKGKTEDESTARFIGLATDTYREGTKILQKSLDLYRMLQNVHVDKLKGEIGAWRHERNQLEQEAAQDDTHVQAQIDALDRKIESNEKRIALFHERTDLLHQFLAQCEELEGALETSYLELVDLVDTETSIFTENAVQSLERAVSSARTVEDRLRGLDDTSEEDAMYLAAGRQHQTTQTE